MHIRSSGSWYTWRVAHVYTSTRGRGAALVGGYAAEDRCLEKKEGCVSALHTYRPSACKAHAASGAVQNTKILAVIPQRSPVMSEFLAKSRRCWRRRLRADGDDVVEGSVGAVVNV